MKLINPRGLEVDIPDKKAKKILANPAKRLQGWKKKVVKKPKAKTTVVKKTTKKKVDGQSDNKK